MDDANREILLTEYRELCHNFRLLTDIRFKLLVFLPVAAAAVMALRGIGAGERFVLSLFGLAATAGLIVYNTRNSQLHRELMRRAAAIERQLGAGDGALAAQSRPWVTVHLLGRPWTIDHAAAAGLIYRASIALWLFELFSATLQALGFTGHGTNLVALVLALAATLWAANDIDRQVTALGAAEGPDPDRGMV